MPPASLSGRPAGAVRIGYDALCRGAARPGDICDLNGSDPLSVDAARSLLPGAFLSAVVTADDDVTDVTMVARLGRAHTRKPGCWQWLTGGGPPAGPATVLGTPLEWTVQISASELAAGSFSTDSFLAAVAAKARSVASLAGPHRSFSVFQRTVLNWTQPLCAVIGCNRTVCTEFDHGIEYAVDPVTDIPNAHRLCRWHHRLKTHWGYRLEDGTGRRRLLPPPPGWVPLRRGRPPVRSTSEGGPSP